MCVTVKVKRVGSQPIPEADVVAHLLAHSLHGLEYESSSSSKYW